MGNTFQIIIVALIIYAGDDKKTNNKLSRPEK